MDEGFLKPYGYYLFWAWLALSLGAAFPEFHPDWVALLAAAAYLRGGLLLSWALSLTLALIFGFFSNFPPWQIAVPLLLTTLGFSSLQKRFSLSSAVTHWLLLAALVAGDMAFRWGTRSPGPFGGRPDRWDLTWGVATVVLGAFALPLAREGMRRLFQVAGSWWRRPGQVGFFRAWLVRRRRSDETRRPFGLEKGM